VTRCRPYTLTLTRIVNRRPTVSTVPAANHGALAHRSCPRRRPYAAHQSIVLDNHPGWRSPAPTTPPICAAALRAHVCRSARSQPTCAWSPPFCPHPHTRPHYVSRRHHTRPSKDRPHFDARTARHHTHAIRYRKSPRRIPWLTTTGTRPGRPISTTAPNRNQAKCPAHPRIHEPASGSDASGSAPQRPSLQSIAQFLKRSLSFLFPTASAPCANQLLNPLLQRTVRTHVSPFSSVLCCFQATKPSGSRRHARRRHQAQLTSVLSFI